jgi:hypothetical protein
MVRLTFPKSHHTEDLRPLYEGFKAEEPEVFARWKEIEENWCEGSERDIAPVMIAIHSYLKPRVQWDTLSAVIFATSDFRKLIRAELSRA